MKPSLRTCLPLVMGVLFLMVVPGHVSALSIWGSKDKSAPTKIYSYDEKTSESGTKGPLEKLDQEKQKCEQAIANTKTLIGRSKNRPYLPELYLRLAELYIEKSRLVFFLRKNQQSEDSDGALEQYESNLLKKQATEIYEHILNNFADFQYIDKVLFFLAHEYSELGQVEKMLSRYMDLIRQFPNSQYTPEAHLLLGDYYFNQKQDVDQSTLHYQSVLKHPKSPAAAAARYKLAWCKINQKDHSGALSLFEDAVISPESQKELDIDTYRRVDVRLESLVDMAYCYPEVYKDATADEALSYFRRYAWSRPVYAIVLEKLAYRYYVKKNWDQTAAIYRQLAALRQDPEKLLEYAKYIYESAQVLGTYQHAEKDVGIIIRALEKLVYSPHVTRSDKDKLIKDYEIHARAMITHLHQKARQTNSAHDFSIAANAYKKYLDFFTHHEKSIQMSENFAEALFSAGDYLAAGKQYEKVLSAAQQGSGKRKEILYSAVISFYRALKDKEKLNFYQAVYARDGLQSLGKTFVREFQKSGNASDVMFNVAWASYDAGHYQEAIEALSRFIERYPKHKAVPAAVHLIMDAYHLEENYDGMIHYGKSILANSAVGDSKLKQEVAQIVGGAQSRVISNMTAAAVDDWENTRLKLINVIDSNAGNDMGEKALNALFLSSRDKKDLVTMMDAGHKLINNFPGSSQEENTLEVLIDTALSIGQLRLLADYLEIFSQRYPKNENNGKFVLQAAQIRQELGQYTQANQNFRQYINQNPVSAQQLDDVVFAMTDNILKSGNQSAALRLLETFQNQLTDIGKVKARAQMALLNLEADRRSQAGKLGQMTAAAYRPEMGQKDPELGDLMAELAYYDVYSRSGPYFKLRLKSGIDNQRVQEKAAQLKNMEAGYQNVLRFKSASWTLRACYESGRINREFADFLSSAPVPEELTREQKTQYQSLIQQKAQSYIDKAQQYMKTCAQLAQKWAVCDPELSKYYLSSEGAKRDSQAFHPISVQQKSQEIGIQGLHEPRFSRIYHKLYKAPEDIQLQHELAVTYLKQGDFCQAALIAKNILSKLPTHQGDLKARLLNLIGMTCMYSGQDDLAKAFFKRAVEADAGVAEARVNLAGLYRHYGHHNQAAELMKAAPFKNLDRNGIHPQIGAIINEYSLQMR